MYAHCARVRARVPLSVYRRGSSDGIMPGSRVPIPRIDEWMIL